VAGKLIYKDRESRDYNRFYATSTVLGGSPRDNLVMDFYEEYISSRMLQNLDFETNMGAYNQEKDDVVVIREKKASILMTRQAALDLARSILDNYKDEEGIES